MKPDEIHNFLIALNLKLLDLGKHPIRCNISCGYSQDKAPTYTIMQDSNTFTLTGISKVFFEELAHALGVEINELQKSKKNPG